MKLLEKKITENGFITLVCEKEILGLFKKKLKFVAVNEIKQGFRSWKYLQNNKIVDEVLAYKLDNWYNNKTLLADIEEHLVYCSLGCPLRKETDDCVFKEAKLIEDINERCDYIRGLKKSEQKKMYKRHKECFIKSGGTIEEWQ